jgi:DNA replication regulator DPB11
MLARFISKQTNKRALVAYRKELEEIINSNGGEYRGDLSRDVTHLIAHKPTGPKYSYAKDSGMHIVAIEWLQQSLERGMVLDEKLYDPLMEASQRGINAWIRRSISTTSLKKRPRREDGVSGPRKLRRTASARSNNQVGIWTDIVGGGYSEDEPKKHEWEEQDQERPVEQEPRKLDQTGEGSYGDVKPLFEAKTPTSDRMFSGKRFYLHGFDKKKVMVSPGIRKIWLICLVICFATTPTSP